MALNYYILDVFTEKPFGGNPLAVVVDADRLDTLEMQAIAREFGLSETVFVLKPENPGHTARLRIFTPRREIRFAGHPTLGAGVLLAAQRMPVINGERDAIITLEAEIGSLRVGVRLREGGAAYAEFDAPKGAGELSNLGRKDETAAALGLIASEIGFENHRPQLLMNSNVFAYVPVTNLEVIGKVHVVASHWQRAFTELKIDGVYVYTRQCLKAASSFHARMFAPDLGIPEDPATGAAAIGFAHVIHSFDRLNDGMNKRTIEQGFEMGRPSTIALAMVVQKSQLTTVRIGGHTVRVAEGTLSI